MEFNTIYLLTNFCPFKVLVIQELGDVKALGGTLHVSTIAQF
jgi:hypothetical protein